MEPEATRVEVNPNNAPKTGGSAGYAHTMKRSAPEASDERCARCGDTVDGDFFDAPCGVRFHECCAEKAFGGDSVPRCPHCRTVTENASGLIAFQRARRSLVKRVRAPETLPPENDNLVFATETHIDAVAVARGRMNYITALIRYKCVEDTEERRAVSVGFVTVDSEPFGFVGGMVPIEPRAHLFISTEPGVAVHGARPVPGFCKVIVDLSVDCPRGALVNTMRLLFRVRIWGSGGAEEVRARVRECDDEGEGSAEGSQRRFEVACGLNQETVAVAREAAKTDAKENFRAAVRAARAKLVGGTEARALSERKLNALLEDGVA